MNLCRTSTYGPRRYHRAMTNDRTLGDRIADKAKEWTINIIQVIVALFVIGGAVNVAMYWLDREYFAKSHAGSWFGNIVARCDSTADDLEVDFKCIDSKDCALSRDELKDHEERLERYNLMCTTEPE